MKFKTIEEFITEGGSRGVIEELEEQISYLEEELEELREQVGVDDLMIS